MFSNIIGSSSTRMLSSIIARPTEVTAAPSS
jgi:hypothetical protein